MCSLYNRYDGTHDPRCPYYSPTRPRITCCYCNEGIYQGERYLDNEQGEYIHEDCVGSAGINWMINWLGFRYETEENDE